jgi:hypothetical protein
MAVVYLISLSAFAAVAHHNPIATIHTIRKKRKTPTNQNNVRKARLSDPYNHLIMRSILALVSLSLAIVFLPSAHSKGGDIENCSSRARCECDGMPNPNPDPSVCQYPCYCQDV